MALGQLPHQRKKPPPLVPERLQRQAQLRELQRDLLLPVLLALQNPRVPAQQGLQRHQLVPPLQRHQLVPPQGLGHQTSLHLLEQERVLRTIHPLPVRETVRQTTHHLLAQAWRQTSLPQLVPAWLRTNHLLQERVLDLLVQF